MRRILLAACCVTSLLSAQLPNGVPAGALPLQLGTNPGAPAGASGNTFTNAGEGAANPPGLPGVCAAGSRDVFFTFVAPASGVLTVETCTPAGFAAGTLGDTVLQALNAAGTASLACNDDNCGLRSRLTLNVAAGQTLLVRVLSFGSSGNGGSFYLTLSLAASGPSNGTLATAIPVFAGINPAAPNGQNGTLFTNEGDPQPLDAGTFPGCLIEGVDEPVSDVWFVFLAECTGVHTVATCPPAGFANEGTIADSVLQAFEGNSDFPVGCNDDAGCGDDGTHSSVSFFAFAGVPYFFRVMALSDGDQGSFYLTVTPPGNGSTAASVTTKGFGCGAPTATLSGTVPVLGSLGTLTVTSQPNSFGVLLLSPPTDVVVPVGNGCSLYVANGAMSVFSSVLTDAAGSFAFSALLPSDPVFTCVEVDVQAVVVQNGQFAFTNGLRLRLGL